jgi:Methyltransferase domain
VIAIGAEGTPPTGHPPQWPRMTSSIERAGIWLRRRIRPFVEWFSIRNRRKKAETIADWMTRHGCHTVLLVGDTGAETRSKNENIVEYTLAQRFEIVMGVNIVQRTTPYPFRVADGRDLPFDDQWVDFALSNAIIEHVGDESDQRRFVAEQSRVARCWAITTPNRWFPVESHTSAVFMHWSPTWRAGRREFTRLLSWREFRELLPPGTELVGHPWSATFMAFHDGR